MAPPECARVTRAAADEDIFDGRLVGGDEAPMTPRDHMDDEEEQATPMEVAHLHALTVQEDDDDVKPIMNLAGANEGLKDDVLRTNVEILRLVMQLGGSARGYRRERSRAINHAVSEIYSAPRVTKALKMLPSMGLSAGFALDLTGEDEGNSWDFTKAEMREKARKKVDQEQPKVLIGSPSCTPYCTWQELNAVLARASPHCIKGL